MNLYRSTGPHEIKQRKRIHKPEVPGRLKPGPKPKPVDWALVGKLARVQCTPREIAAVLDTNESVLTAWPQFASVYKKGYDSGNASLRRLQWRTASDGNYVMQIFLGKQRLGQADKFVSQLSGPNGGAIEFETKHKPDLGKLTFEELSVLLALVDKAGAAPKKEKEPKP
jgi:hypothetical protein